MSSKVFVHEVGLRDGLQMEATIIPTKKKLDWALQLIASGVDVIQLGSFVHPKKVPQMADTDDLFNQLAALDHAEDITLSGLVLNEKGLERGLSCRVDLFCMGVSASETHSRKNTGMGVEEALDRIITMAREAVWEGRRVQVLVQSAFGCGYEGAVPEAKVLGIVERYLDAGLTSISLADTAGRADPRSVQRLFAAINSLGEDVQSACHFHNNFGLALANCWAALEAGVTWFESSFGGLGGCPFTAVPGGNTCTEDLVHMFQRLEIERKIKLSKLIDTVLDVSSFFARDLPGSVYRAGVPEPS